MKFTGGQIIAKALKANSVDYVAGPPGDGARALVEALLTPGTDIPFIHVIQAHSAVHLADGYYRACGRPMAVVLTGPLGIPSALGALATAHQDACALLVISNAQPETIAANVMKDHATVSTLQQLPQALRQAFDTMLSAHPGPVSLSIDDALQGASTNASLPPATLRAEPQPTPRKISVLREGRASSSVLENDAILVIGSGPTQPMARKMFPVHYPGRHLCAGNPATLGWAVPAAIGAKLAMPARQVVCAVGSRDFLQSMQEMAVCVMHSIPVVFLVFNSNGDEALGDVQTSPIEQHRAGEFNLPDGKPYAPDFAGIARNFGLEAWRVEHASQLNATLVKALNSKGPSLVEMMTARQPLQVPQS
ncbi:thiamine pyrophosphate-dependent enzyme [Pseudomonas sp. NPDC087814]|uniref:thiamine pyrophosphate-dependent enzyme n=2 Tax=Pseudomonas TaxID=286 RepID=UPI0015A36C6F|nr:thiamine pyrophosphate-binding protein [Pseudomonas sp. I8001]